MLATALVRSNCFTPAFALPRACSVGALPHRGVPENYQCGRFSEPPGRVHSSAQADSHVKSAADDSCSVTPLHSGSQARNSSSGRPGPTDDASMDAVDATFIKFTMEGIGSPICELNDVAAMQARLSKLEARDSKRQNEAEAHRRLTTELHKEVKEVKAEARELRRQLVEVERNGEELWKREVCARREADCKVEDALRTAFVEADCKVEDALRRAFVGASGSASPSAETDSECKVVYSADAPCKIECSADGVATGCHDSLANLRDSCSSATPNVTGPPPLSVTPSSSVSVPTHKPGSAASLASLARIFKPRSGSQSTRSLREVLDCCEEEEKEARSAGPSSTVLLSATPPGSASVPVFCNSRKSLNTSQGALPRTSQSMQALPRQSSPPLIHAPSAALPIDAKNGLSPDAMTLLGHGLAGGSNSLGTLRRPAPRAVPKVQAPKQTGSIRLPPG